MDRKEGQFDVIANLASLKRYARSLVRDNADAEDLVQEALVKAYERRSTFRAGSNLRNWLFSILHNTHIDKLRSHQSRLRRDGLSAAHTETVIPASQEDAVQLRQIQEAFMRLPLEQREALHLVAVEELSYQQAAEALGIPVGTLMSRVSRARSALRNADQLASTKTYLRLVGGGNE